jgi:hypothetical protein
MNTFLLQFSIQDEYSLYGHLYISAQYCGFGGHPRLMNIYNMYGMPQMVLVTILKARGFQINTFDQNYANSK